MKALNKIKNESLKLFEKIKNKTVEFSKKNSEIFKKIFKYFITIILVAILLCSFLYSLKKGMEGEGYSLTILTVMSFLLLVDYLNEFAIEMEEIKNKKIFMIIGIIGFVVILVIWFYDKESWLKYPHMYITFATFFTFILTKLILFIEKIKKRKG